MLPSFTAFSQFIRLFGFFLAILSPAVGVETEAPAKTPGKGIQVRLLADQAPAELGKVFLAFGEEAKSTLISLPTNQLSEPLIAPARLMVLKMAAKEIPLCNIVLPEQGNAFAVVLVAAKPAGYAPIVVRTDDPAFKAGDVIFINRSEKTVLGKLGTTPLILKPGQSTKNRPSGAVDGKFYDVAFATREEKGDKLISSSRWPIDNQLRSYVFFFTNGQGKTSFRAVDEYLTPPAVGKP